MKYIFKQKINITWITILILSNLLTLYSFSHNFFHLPNTIVLYNESTEFLDELEKLNLTNRIINSQFIGDLDNTTIGENLISYMFTQLGDKYSEYYTIEEYSDYLNTYSGSFGGIGVVIDSSDPTALLITDVTTDSPAQKAGIIANDVIIKVDDEDVTGMDIKEVVSKTRGEVGTDVKLTVLRNGEELEFTITRDTIDNNTINTENFDGIGYIYISQFGTGTGEQFTEAVDELIDQGITGLVIDLRSNGGGIVNSAIEVADYLLDAETIGYSVNKNGVESKFTTEDGKIDIPFVVLVDKNTASASELLAGSLQKNGVPIIGENTYGKGVIQAMGKLYDGSGYKLTVQEYFLSDGTKVNGIGIIPDVEAIYTTELDEDGNHIDNHLNTALEILRNN